MMVINFYLHVFSAFISSFAMFIIMSISWCIDERDHGKKSCNDNNKAIQIQKVLLTSLLSIVDLVVSKIQ